MAEEYGNDSERLNGIIGTYRAKKGELFPNVEDLTPAEAFSLRPESILFVDARSDGGESSLSLATKEVCVSALAPKHQNPKLIPRESAIAWIRF